LADSLLPRWVADLTSGDAAVRERAAAGIFSSGRESGETTIEQWAHDAEAGALFLRDSAGRLRPTVGVAVLPETFERIRAACGSPRLADVPPDQDAREFELHFPGGVALDILTTRDPGGAGAIAKFLAKFGEGIQQVEFLVRDVARITEILRSSLGVAPIYPAARPGADGTSVNFFLVPSSGGNKILIELVEARRK
jgi:hypothetical protein